ncbi:two-component sensor histidine kinase [Pseudorhizobium tarimense]|uniref:histidine kinase n=1 Tax=Pseudorhizobium tarimense TaxID=1079109 RepID=A0ABV2H912_9HYPH|nr:HWE histidine kinase domain-containing protein [Pseudorhizobium tarimense]MCJ8520133.1 histidine kinase [Pseudorhizobium tarimense]
MSREERLPRFFPTASIGAYLVALSAVVAIPLVVFVVFLMIELERRDRVLLAANTAEDAQVVARSVDRALQDMATTLRILAGSPELDQGDFQAFHNRVQNSLRSNSLYAIAVDASGQQLLNTRVPFGTPLGRTSSPATLQKALDSGVTQISDVFFGPTSGRFVFNVVIPLSQEMAQSSGAAALIITQNAEDLQRLLSIESLPPQWSVAILDAGGAIVTSLGESNASSISAFPEETIRLMSGVNGTIEDLGGEPEQIYGYAQIVGSQWKAVVWGPISTAQAAILSTSRQLIVGSVLFLAIGMLCGYLIARQLRIPIRQIAEMAERIGRGEIVPPVETRIREANQISVALSNASFDRSQAEDKMHFILHELVHRTKNILTLVQAMMRQLARQGDSMEEFQKAISTRLQGLGRSIEVLASEQWVGVPLKRLVTIQLETFAEASNRVELDGEDIALKAEAVQNLGLVLHELATNSLKYGALSVPEGKVIVSWRQDAPSDLQSLLRLTWKEVGGPPAKEPERTGFGTKIIRRHAEASFGGKVDIRYDASGFSWILVAPREAFERNLVEAIPELVD